MKRVVTAFMIIGFAAVVAACTTTSAPGIDTQPIGAPPPQPPLETQPVDAPPPPPPVTGS